MAAAARTLISKQSYVSRPLFRLLQPQFRITSGLRLLSTQQSQSGRDRDRVYPGLNSIKALPNLTESELFAKYYGVDDMYWKVSPDYEEFPDNRSRDEIIDSCIKILADVLGSEEEARNRMHSVSTELSYHFVCRVPPEIAARLWGEQFIYVEPLSEAQVERADYLHTGEPFVNGKPVPYDPKYYKAIRALLGQCPHRERTYRKRRLPQASTSFVVPQGQSLRLPQASTSFVVPQGQSL